MKTILVLLLVLGSLRSFAEEKEIKTYYLDANYKYKFIYVDHQNKEIVSFFHKCYTPDGLLMLITSESGSAEKSCKDAGLSTVLPKKKDSGFKLNPYPSGKK